MVSRTPHALSCCTARWGSNLREGEKRGKKEGGRRREEEEEEMESRIGRKKEGGGREGREKRGESKMANCCDKKTIRIDLLMFTEHWVIY